MMTKQVPLLLLNGGVGSRVDSTQPKQFIRLHNIPLFIYALRIIDEIPEISRVICNFPRGWRSELEGLVGAYALNKPTLFCEAGETRQESVFKMMEHVSLDHEKVLLIHETARPLADKSLFLDLLNCQHENVILSQPLHFSVLKTAGSRDVVLGTIDRSTVVNVQLPHKFNSRDLYEAHQKARREGLEYTEDAAMVFDAGFRVNILEGSPLNFKITNVTDLMIASKALEGSDE